MSKWMTVGVLLLLGTATAGENEPTFKEKTAPEWAAAVLLGGEIWGQYSADPEPAVGVLSAGREQAQAVLAVLVEDPRPSVRARVARHVLGTTTAARDLMADAYSKWAAITLLRMLEDESPEVRVAAAWGLHHLAFHLGELFVRPGADTMAVHNGSFRNSTAVANHGPILRAAGRKLRELRTDPVPMVRQEAQEVYPGYFRIAHDPAQQEPTADLVAALTGKNHESAKRATRLLAGRSADAEVVVPALLQAAKTRAFLRRKAIDSLASFGPAAAEALPELRRIMNKGSRGDRPVAALAVWRISGEVEGPIAALRLAIDRGWGSGRARALKIALEMAEEAAPLVDAIAPRFLKGTALERQWALQALRRTNADRAQVVALHIDALRDRSSMVRLTAARGLGLLGDPPDEALPYLIALLEEEHPYARMQAAYAIRRCGPRGAAAATALGELLDAYSTSVRREAAQALLAIGSSGQAPLIAACSSKESFVRGEVAGALGSVSPTTPEIQIALAALLEDPVRYVRLEAAVALVQSGGDSSGPIRVVCAALRTEEAFDREWAAEALLRMGPEAVPGWIAALAAEPKMLDATAGAILLVPEGRREFLPGALESLTGSEDEQIDTAAARTLARLRSD